MRGRLARARGAAWSTTYDFNDQTLPSVLSDPVRPSDPIRSTKTAPLLATRAVQNRPSALPCDRTLPSGAAMSPPPEQLHHERRQWLLRLVGAVDPQVGQQRRDQPESAENAATAPKAALGQALVDSPSQPPTPPAVPPRPRNRAPTAIPSVRVDADDCGVDAEEGSGAAED